MDARTFMVLQLVSLLVSVYDPSPSEIIRGHFDRNLIAGQYPDVVHAHLSGNSCQDEVIVL
jgi:hypothetical protein